jgi:hypothetical protein
MTMILLSATGRVKPFFPTRSLDGWMGRSGFASQNGALAFFQKWISRTDKNFTYFSAIKKANTLGGIGLSLIQKTLSPGWNDHVVSRFKVIFF